MSGEGDGTGEQRPTRPSSFLELKETKWATSHTSLAGQKMQSGAGTFLRMEALKEPWHRSVVP